MAFNSLKELYIDQLQDLYSANRQSIEITRELSQVANDEELSKALSDGVNGIGDGLSILNEIISEHGEDPTGEFCKGMEGLVKEVRAHVLNVDFADSDIKDAAIIPQYQRMVHYALAGYGTVVAFANRLELDGDAAKLQKALDDTYGGDRRMTQIAQNGINKEAAKA